MHYCTTLVWSFKTRTFGNVSFRQNVNRHTEVRSLFHFIYCAFSSTDSGGNYDNQNVKNITRLLCRKIKTLMLKGYETSK